MGHRYMARRPVAVDTNNVQTATNAVCTRTFAATQGKSWALEYLAASYSAAPTGGRLFVESPSGTVVFDADLTTAGPHEFLPALKAPANQAVVVKLAAGGAGIVGKLNAHAALE